MASQDSHRPAGCPTGCWVSFIIAIILFATVGLIVGYLSGDWCYIKSGLEGINLCN